MYNVKLAQLTKVRFVAVRSWFTPDRDICVPIFYNPVCILSSKTNNFGKVSQPKLLHFQVFSVARIGKGYDPILTPGPNVSLYKSYYGVETPSNLIYIVLKDCIERVEYHLAERFLRSFLKAKDARSIRATSELNFFSIHAKIHFASRCRPSFDSRYEPCIVPKKIVNVFCLPTKIL